MALDKKLGLIHMTSRQLTLVEKADCLSVIISSTLGGLDMVVGKIRNRGRGALLGWNYVGDRGALLEGDTGDKDRGAVSEVVGAEDEGAPLEGWSVWRTRELRRRGVVGVRDDGALAGRSGWCRGRGSCVGGVVLAGDKGAPSERGYIRDEGESLEGGVWCLGQGSSLGRLEEARFLCQRHGSSLGGLGEAQFFTSTTWELPRRVGGGSVFTSTTWELPRRVGVLTAVSTNDNINLLTPKKNGPRIVTGKGTLTASNQQRTGKKHMGLTKDHKKRSYSKYRFVFIKAQGLTCRSQVEQPDSEAPWSGAKSSPVIDIKIEPPPTFRGISHVIDIKMEPPPTLRGSSHVVDVNVKPPTTFRESSHVIDIKL
ncbi:hypothetical protein FA13DRAFT_1710716 [Coprinellus micaceus]|uniref:Uncharacterized protein n=1 Tax=Coprinellus micaceus TaxID=71717 RepID=A0A4Y7T6K5_COPMI|nr:hypothetical protein FA13DRAFT_1710716 [Coprinellus micaceus]